MTTVTAWPLIDGLYRAPRLSGLGLVAGFTTRAEGSLAGSVFPHTEQDEARRRLARRLGFDDVVRVRQVHGDRVLRVPFVRPGPGLTPAGAPAPAPAPAEPPSADAMWTDERGVLLGVAAADCAPVFVADPAGPIGVAHAGWEGTSKRVAQALVGALVEAGSDPATLHAAVGPAIGPCCYTIDAERAELIRSRLGPAATDALRSDRDRIVFDLAGTNVTQLADSGVREIEVSGLCTRCGGADLWSYRARAERGPQGTGLGVLGWPA